jgi:hypothetical protein
VHASQVKTRSIHENCRVWLMLSVDKTQSTLCIRTPPTTTHQHHSQRNATVTTSLNGHGQSKCQCHLLGMHLRLSICSFSVCLSSEPSLFPRRCRDSAPGFCSFSPRRAGRASRRQTSLRTPAYKWERQRVKEACWCHRAAESKSIQNSLANAKIRRPNRRAQGQH